MDFASIKHLRRAENPALSCALIGQAQESDRTAEAAKELPRLHGDSALVEFDFSGMWIELGLPKRRK